MYDSTQAAKPIPTIINCPSCEKPTAYHPHNPYRPFCSKRCQTIDLGAWASEQHTIAGKSPYDTIDPDPAYSEEV